MEVGAWLALFRRFWSAHADALERHLDCTDHSEEDQVALIKKKQGKNEAAQTANATKEKPK